jgi:hypothetical protein
MQSQIEASQNLKSSGLNSTTPSSPSTRTFKTSANPNRQSLASDSSSSFLSTDTANAVSNPRRRQVCPTTRRTESRRQRRTSYFCTGPRPQSAALGRCRFARPGRGARYPPTQETSVEPSSPHLTFLASADAAFRTPFPDGGVAPGCLAALPRCR